ncbi:MAG TPA: thioredoxin-like domain-containing protein [Gemmataceae bacterium]|nr:thioredoxin-like domain-containing protein [Gemmataceae bacterium]
MTKAHTAGLCGGKSLSRIKATTRRWLAGCLLLGLAAAPATAAPKAEDMLKFRPRQEGVVCTTPAADKLAACKVELVKGSSGSGWVLKDEEGNLLRRFFDSNGDNRIDVWSYYKDGLEVYTEIDTTFTGKPDQYRWLNSGGSKWGVDENKDGRIDSWKTISPEEVSQEVLSALINHDFTRLQPLMLTETEVKALGLPAEQTSRILEQIKAAPEKFKETVDKLTKLSAKATWIHLETVAPQCIATGTGGRSEVIKHSRGTLLYDSGSGSDWIQTGEMYQLGHTWRLVSAPTPGASAPETSSGKGSQISMEENPELQKIVAELTELDKNVPASAGGTNAKLAQHHLKRADVLERIVAKVKPAERDPWIRQVADSLSTAAQASETRDTAAMDRLINLEKQLGGSLPAGHKLTAYVTFREIQADFSRRANGSSNTDFTKMQQAYLERLAKFVQSFPEGEDTADALLQAGMTSEIMTKEVEAKNWYRQLVQHFPDKPQARKAEGSIARLELEGKVLKLAGPMLNDANVAFDIDQVRGKIAIVYYWASWNNQCAGEFTKLKQMLDAHSGKLDLVCVNLDNSTEEARKYLSSSPAPGTHLHQDGGLEGKMATDYGIQVLPTIFLVGKDGKVVSRNGQIANLEDEIKKLLK